MAEITETAIESPPEPKKKYFSKRKLAKYITITLLAFSVGFIHYRYVSHLFENDRYFSSLSEMEREMSFRTEMGFYYSFYKTIVQERPFMSGISKLMYDRLVEHPKDVNAFNRFNIHPEVLIGAVYRYLEPILNSTRRQCDVIDRGRGLTPVESCVGIGQPVMFYLEAIWVLAGLTSAAVFLHAASLSETILGGVLAVIQYFSAHVECTRVQWAPNERENMAAPLLMLQAWLVSLQLRNRGGKHGFQLQVSIFIINCLCLLFWQFTQFIFLTQTAIFFVMEQIRVIDLKSLCILLHSHFCGLHMAILLLQGNDMLKSSLYTSFFVIVSAYCLLFSSLRVKIQNRFDLMVETWLVFLRIAIVICCSLYLKKILSDFLNVEEDSHIWDILFSKFTNFKSFHTLLYTCSAVFDFLPFSTVKKVILSMLIPFVVVSIINVLSHWILDAKKEMEHKCGALEKDGKSDDEDSGIEENIKKKTTDKSIENDKLLCFLNNLNIEPAIFYNISQMVVYGVMAFLVMRLKMLFVPQMCVISSLYFNKSYYRLPKKYMKYVPIVWMLSLVAVFYQLYVNVSEEMSHIGEFSDIHQEKLFEWIMKETSKTSAFAGSMPLMASLMLVTRRPIVTHPHYEHVQARQRAYSVYKVYGRFTAEELYEELNRLRVTYIIVETKYCFGRSSKGCSFSDIWDTERPDLKDHPLLCTSLLASKVDHFYPVYRDTHYAVYRLHDYSVRYMPRSFDT